MKRKEAFKREIWEYYREHRRDLPWRKKTTPYRVLVSEIMLQQTQVERVRKKFQRFIKMFPNITTLAGAHKERVLAAWQGLGYNRRALALKKAAEMIVCEYGGKLPEDIQLLEQLPGVGKATAGALRAFAFNKSSVFIETNIRRVYIQFFFSRRRNVQDKEIESLIQATLPESQKTREWYYALMDYGAMLGKCDKIKNPNRRSAHYMKQKPFKGSKRELRGRVLRYVLENGSVTEKQLKKITGEKRIVRMDKVLLSLIKEEFISKNGKEYSIRRK